MLVGSHAEIGDEPKAVAAPLPQIIGNVQTAAGSGPKAYGKVAGFVDSYFGRLVLFGYTWALIHHMLGGIRHLIWDTGHGFGPNEREWLARATLLGSITLTIMIWIVGYFFVGGPR